MDSYVFVIFKIYKIKHILDIVINEIRQEKAIRCITIIKKEVKITLLRDYFFYTAGKPKGINAKTTITMRKFSKGAGYEINLNLSIYLSSYIQTLSIRRHNGTEDLIFNVKIRNMTIRNRLNFYEENGK